MRKIYVQDRKSLEISFDCSLHKLIDYLKNVWDDCISKGYKYIIIEKDSNDGFDEYFVVYDRLETEQEQAIRIKKSKRIKDDYNIAKKLQEESERREYERLKKKYGEKS